MREIIQSNFNINHLELIFLLLITPTKDDNILIDEVIRFYNTAKEYYKIKDIAHFLKLAVSTVYNFNVLLKKNDYNINPIIRNNIVYQRLGLLYQLINEVHKDEK